MLKAAKCSIFRGRVEVGSLPQRDGSRDPESWNIVHHDSQLFCLKQAHIDSCSPAPAQASPSAEKTTAASVASRAAI